MFTRARLHLTLLYVVLLGVTVVLVAGAIGFFAVQEAHATDDRELQIRANAIASGITGPPPPSFNVGSAGVSGPSAPASNAGAAPTPSAQPGPDRGPGPGRGDRPPPLEGRGVLEYIMPVFNGQLRPPQDSSLPGLPSVTDAQKAMASGKAIYTSLTVQGSQVRLYTLPVVRGGQT